MIMTYWKSFRAVLIYTLVILLGFQPAAMAIGEARLKRLELALMQSEMTKRQITLQEFLDAYSGTLPPALRVAAEQVLLVDPNFRLPKINVQKIKGADGATNLQLNFTDKVAGSASMYLEDANGQFQIKWGGETLTQRDWTNAQGMMAKVSKAAKIDPKNQPFFVKDPNYSKTLRFYSNAEYSKLKPAKQQKYRKSYIGLLAAIEKVQLAQKRTQEVMSGKAKSKKTSSLMEFEMWWSLMVAQAEADEEASEFIKEGDSCIAAGRIAKWGKRPDGDKKFSCGGAQQSEILCDNGELKCEESLFGPGLCAPNILPKVATLGCAEKSPRFTGFPNLPPADKTSIREQIAALQAGPCSEAVLNRVQATETRDYPGSNIYQDQKLACMGLAEAQQRFVEDAPAAGGEEEAGAVDPASSTSSTTTTLAQSVPPATGGVAAGEVDPCKAPRDAGARPGTPAPPAGTGRGEAAPGLNIPGVTPRQPPALVCTEEDLHRVEHDPRRPARTPSCQDVERSGQGVRSTIAASAVWDCLDVLDATRLNEYPDGYCSPGGNSGRTLPYYHCECPPGEKASIDYGKQGSGASVRCPSKMVDDDGGRRGKGDGKGFLSGLGNWFRKNGKWLLALFGGLLAFWLHDKAIKKSMDENFRINFPPTTTLPPAPAPPPPPPTPRT